MRAVSMQSAFRWMLALVLVAGSGLAAALDLDRINVSEERLRGAAAEPDNWLLHGRTDDEGRFSPLDQINDRNVADLKLAWAFDTDYQRGLESSPIVVDGLLIATGTWSLVYAHDARTGRLLWKYDPKVPKSRGRSACCDAVNRGVAVWRDRVFVGTLDGRLVALDLRTGQPVWETLTVDTSRPYTITGAPRVVKGKVIIGNGGAELGVRGYVSAYDADTGALVWRFWTVPGNPADGFENQTVADIARTWSGTWWVQGGGGTVWDSIAYDPELDLLYIGVGNGSPWNRYLRNPEGLDNLFLTSIVALRPDTGAYVWHYQQVPNEGWDYTATQHMILADIPWQGVTRKVLMQAPKNGFFFLLDRATGEFLSAKPFVEVTWAKGYDAKGRPIENKALDYRDAEQLVRPSPLGAHNWHPMSYNPQTRLVYIPAQDSAMPYFNDGAFEYKPGYYNTAVGAEHADQPADALLQQSMLRRFGVGTLLAWDPSRQQPAWRIRHPVLWNGGILSTAGNLVFQGTGDGRFVAYTADRGRKLWEFDAQSGIIAPPVTYSVGGEQFVVVQAGWGGGFALPMAQVEPDHLVPGRTLAFSLSGTAKLPPAAPRPRHAPPPRMAVGPERLKQGMQLYNRFCVHCHGAFVHSGSAIPDLRFMHESRHQAFQQIVLGGLLADRGMGPFTDVLNADQVEAIHAYIIDRANATLEAESGPEWWRSIRQWSYERLVDAMLWFN